MFNPLEPINFNRTDKELEEVILYLIAVAGKKSDQTIASLNSFLYTGWGMYEPESPFWKVKMLDKFTSTSLHSALVKARFGCYRDRVRYFRDAAGKGLDLRTCTLEELMDIKGIGRKSASLFLMWTRPAQQLSGLDTHILKHMRTLVDESVVLPKSTPSNKKMYDFLEDIYLKHCDELGVDPTEYDLELWKKYSGN